MQSLRRLTLGCCALAWAAIADAASATEGTHALAHQSAAHAAGGDFVLASADGPVALKSYRGQVAVIYFGYTFCPDVCPTTLWRLNEALKTMMPSEVDAIQPIFISLDPARDDAKRLKTYAEFYNPKLLGLTGPDKELKRIADQYGVVYAKQKVDSASGYVLDHSSFLYVTDRSGKLAARLPHGTGAQEIASTLRDALKSD